MCRSVIVMNFAGHKFRATPVSCERGLSEHKKQFLAIKFVNRMCLIVLFALRSRILKEYGKISNKYDLTCYVLHVIK